MKKLTQITFLMIFFALALPGISCDKGLTPIPSESDGKPGAAPRSQAITKKDTAINPTTVPRRNVVEPDFLKGAWKGVKLKIVNKQSGDSAIQNVPLNDKTQIAGTDLTVEVTHFFPSFLMTGDTITSVSNEPTNPAAYIIVHEQGRERVKHWMFAKMPQVHGLQHDRWSLILLDGIPAP